MGRTKTDKAENFVKYINGVSGRLDHINSTHDTIEQKLKLSKKNGSDLLNNSFDTAFGLKEENNKE